MGVIRIGFYGTKVFSLTDEEKYNNYYSDKRRLTLRIKEF